MNARQSVVAVLGLAIIVAGAAALWRAKSVQRLGAPGIKVTRLAGTDKLRIELPARVLDYDSTNGEPSESELKTLPADTTFAKRYYRAPDGFCTLMTVVMMGTDRTSIHKPEYCLTSQGWQITDRERISIAMERPVPYSLPVQRFTTSRMARDGSGRVTVENGIFLFWFVADGKLTASHLVRVSQIAWDLLRTGVLPRWAYVTCFSTCAPGQENATFERMKAFLASAVPEFQATVPAQVQGRKEAVVRQ